MLSGEYLFLVKSLVFCSLQVRMTDETDVISIHIEAMFDCVISAVMGRYGPDHHFEGLLVVYLGE